MNLLMLLFWVFALPFVVGLAIVGSVSWLFAFAYYMVPALFIVLLFLIEVVCESIRSALCSAGGAAPRDD